MLVHRARDRTDRLLDFFVAVPGLGARRPRPAEMEAIDIDFDGEYHAGLPDRRGVVRGSRARRPGWRPPTASYGSLPWPRLFEPALELARDGVELTRPQAYLHAILDLILRHTPEGRRIYGAALAARRRRPARARRPRGDARAALRARAPPRSTAGDRRGGSSRHLREQGGAVTPPTSPPTGSCAGGRSGCASAAHEFVSNPPPSSGGVLIGYGLRLLDALGPGAPAGKRGRDRCAGRGDARAGPRAQREASRATCTGAVSRARLCSTENVRAALGRIRAGLEGAAETADRGTTHISVVDAHGNAASLTASTGSGSGVIVPGTRDPPEQHARRVRPEPGRRRRSARDAADEHDGAVDRAPPAAARGWSSAARARSGCAGRSSRRS